jgi:hypothetical protein
VPQSLRLDRNQIDVRILWWIWWIGLGKDDGLIHLLKEIIIKSKLILAAYKFRNEDPQMIRNIGRWLSECSVAMEYFEDAAEEKVLEDGNSVVEAITNADIQLTESIISSPWNTIF